MSKRKDLKIIASMIKPKSRVLDLGCGDGNLLNDLIQKKQVSGLGIEIDIEKIKKCLENGVSVVQEDLNEGLKDFNDNSFDYIILSQTLEHISKPIYLIKDMLRVGKKCIISFDNIAYWKNRISFLFKGNLDRGHYQKEVVYREGKQHLLTIKKFLELCKLYNISISDQIYLPHLKIVRKFPNSFSKTAIYVLKKGNRGKIKK
ncbi:MAG: methyltransferase domain-containing protein [Candidatus Lokiarchaeota archaeon]|nr:methyltransferase domain-containing protein [Candidatus Lokiarchaeota archaeon]